VYATPYAYVPGRPNRTRPAAIIGPAVTVDAYGQGRTMIIAALAIEKIIKTRTGERAAAMPPFSSGLSNSLQKVGGPCKI